MDFINGPIFLYLILPFLIILARIVDVSFGTVKIIFIARGYNKLVPLLSFFESFVWLIAVTRIFENLNNWVCFIAYPLGFALGNFIGILIEEKIAFGVEIIRVITKSDATELIKALQNKGFGVTSVKAEGSRGEVGIIYSVVNRKNIAQIVNTIKEYNPKAFYTIEDIRYVSQEIIAVSPTSHQRRLFSVRS